MFKRSLTLFSKRCFLDIQIAGKSEGRLVFKLFDEVAPKTCQNFRALCKGDQISKTSGKPMCYANSPFFRVIPGFIAQGGDVVNKGNITERTGHGGDSIYGDRFDDEGNFELDHSHRGILSMANAGENTNASQFFVCLDENPNLDGLHVVFGDLVEGHAVLDKIEDQGMGDGGATLRRIVINDCGVLDDTDEANKSG